MPQVSVQRQASGAKKATGWWQRLSVLLLGSKVLRETWQLSQENSARLRSLDYIWFPNFKRVHHLNVPEALHRVRGNEQQEQ